MGAKKVTLDNFDKEIEKILEQYGDDVSENMDKITRSIGQKGAKLLRNESKAKIPNDDTYSSKWTTRTERKRMYTVATVYSKVPGLPHLLEYGHALVNGGRKVGETSAFTHIKPVEEKMIRQFEREVMTKL